MVFPEPYTINIGRGNEQVSLGERWLENGIGSEVILGFNFYLRNVSLM